METKESGVTRPGQREPPPAHGRAASTIAPDEDLESGPEASEDSSDNVDATDLEALSPEKTEDLVGFSIGHEQLRMKSPTTPAAEKARALDQSKNYFDLEPARWEVHEGHASLVTNQGSHETAAAVLHGPGTEVDGPGDRPSPISPPHVPVPSTSRPVLKEALGPQKRHSSSGSPGMMTAMKKLLPDIPSLSLPKAPTLSSLGLGPKPQAENQLTRPKRSTTLFSRDNLPWTAWAGSSPAWNNANQTSNGIASHAQDGQHVYSPPGPQSQHDITDVTIAAGANANGHASNLLSPSPTHGRLLRRATSEASLFMRNDLQRTSTRDDAERWADVSEQINARFKAITDSLQDSAITRLPKMPSVSLASFKPGLQRGSSGGASAAAGTESNGELSEPAAERDLKMNGPDLPPSSVPRDARRGKHAHPILHRASSDLTGDVVVLGGYRGSILRSAKPPKKQLWVPVKVGMNLRRVDLEVGLHAEDEEKMSETIVPSGVLSHIGPVDICRRLLRHLKKSSATRPGELRVHNYGYDWRLSPHLLSRQLVDFLQSLECNRPGVKGSARGAVIIAHSLGGVITRHAVNQRPDLFAGVIYAGVPQHCINILGPLRNGDDVLLSSRVLTAQVNFTLRSSYALLPESGRCFINKTTGERYDVDFFDVKTWQEHALSPCISASVPWVPLEQRKGIISTLSDSLTSLPFTGKKNPSGRRDNPAAEAGRSSVEDAGGSARHGANGTAHKTDRIISPSPKHELEPSIGSPPFPDRRETVATACTIPLGDALAYLERTLTSIRQFKQELAFNGAHQAADVYPPASVLYSSSVPTVFAARVDSREAIKRSDAFDNLAFAAGDGIVLSNSARPPEGYKVVKGGLVKSERGHIGLLGDLEAVGTCLQAIVNARKRGVGTGKFAEEEEV